MMLTLMMVSYTATSMSLAIAAGQSVVAVANLLMTITFVFMTVSSTTQFPRLNPEILEMLKCRSPTSTEFSWILQKDRGAERVEYPNWSDLNIRILRVGYADLSFQLTRSGEAGSWV